MDIITFLKYIILGIVQGITEPLPVSSSAHVLILARLLKMDDVNLNFEIIINFASTLAIFMVFRKSLWQFIKNLFTKKHDAFWNWSLVIKLIIASLPIAIAGLLLNEKIDYYFVNHKVASYFLILTAGMLFYTAFLYKKYDQEIKSNISYLDSIVIGTTQVIAIIPGVSRSGTTMLAGATSKINLKETVQFSFLLYLIASLGAFILSLSDFNWHDANLYLIISAFIASYIATRISTSLFFNRIKPHFLNYFAIYCLVVSVLVIIFLK